MRRTSNAYKRALDSSPGFTLASLPVQGVDASDRGAIATGAIPDAFLLPTDAQSPARPRGGSSGASPRARWDPRLRSPRRPVRRGRRARGPHPQGSDGPQLRGRRGRRRHAVRGRPARCPPAGSTWRPRGSPWPPAGPPRRWAIPSPAPGRSGRRAACRPPVKRRTLAEQHRARRRPVRMTGRVGMGRARRYGPAAQARSSGPKPRSSISAFHWSYGSVPPEARRWPLP